MSPSPHIRTQSPGITTSIGTTLSAPPQLSHRLPSQHRPLSLSVQPILLLQLHRSMRLVPQSVYQLLLKASLPLVEPLFTRRPHHRKHQVRLQVIMQPSPVGQGQLTPRYQLELQAHGLHSLVGELLSLVLPLCYQLFSWLFCRKYTPISHGVLFTAR